MPLNLKDNKIARFQEEEPDKNGVILQTNRPQRVSSQTLIGLILVVAVIGLVIMMVFERYFTPYMSNKVLLRIVLLGILINICIMFFLIYSFSRVSFAVGPPGPTGVRGLIGPSGANSEINKCSKQIKTITKERNDRIRARTIVVQKPAIEGSDN